MKFSNNNGKFQKVGKIIIKEVFYIQKNRANL